MEVVEKLSDTDAPRSPQLETPVDQDQVSVDDNLHDAFDNPLAQLLGSASGLQCRERQLQVDVGASGENTVQNL